MSTSHHDSAQSNKPANVQLSFANRIQQVAHSPKPLRVFGILFFVVLFIILAGIIMLMDNSHPTVEQLIKKQVAKVEHDQPAAENCYVQKIINLNSTRYYILIDCHLRSNSASSVQDAQEIAFALQKTLWTSGLPIGYVITYIFLPGWGEGTGSDGLPVSASAGYSFMSRQDWTQLNPRTWADLLRKNENQKGTDEDYVWYREFGK